MAAGHLSSEAAGMAVESNWGCLQTLYGSASWVALAGALRRHHPVTLCPSAHGFRSSFSTLMHEKGHDSALIELCLAHADANAVRRSTTGPSGSRSGASSCRAGRTIATKSGGSNLG